jgi:hypothetical protein
MKILSLLMWVGQFGFSILFPTVFFLLVGVWLQSKFSLGIWILILFGIFGILTSVSTAKACLRYLCKAAEEASGDKRPGIGFNDHQ